MLPGGNMDVDREALVQAFLHEADENLGSMEQSLIALEAKPGDEGTIQALFRSAHTLKGNASTLGFDAFRDLAHSLEDVLEGLRSRQVAVSKELITKLLASVDALRGMVSDMRGAASGQPSSGRPGESQAGAGEPTLRVRLGKLDYLLGLVGRISVLEGQMGAILLGAWEERNEDLRELHGRIERLLMELQDWVMDARLVPVGPAFRAQARAVRDVSTSQRKPVRLKIEGEEVAVDSSILEGIRDALTHLVRNAVDHGIEPAVVRAAHGKPPEGTITLRAVHDANRIIIQVSDDGAGFDLAKIRARASALGIPNALDLPADKLRRLVFQSGFSTTDVVTDLSGRGVGMDVVLRRVEALHGTVDVESVEGQGSTIELRLPLTLSVIDGFWVRAGGEDYVIPLGDVVECVELTEERSRAAVRGRSAAQGLIDLRGDAVPFFHLRSLFALGTAAPAIEQVVILRYGGRKLGIAVDEINGQRQTTIKPLNRLFKRLPLVSGSTLRPDGRVALVLDVPGLLRAATRATEPRLEAAHDEVD